MNEAKTHAGNAALTQERSPLAGSLPGLTLAQKEQYDRDGFVIVPQVFSHEECDAVIFDGKLIHRGGPIGVPGSFRHVMANHYIPYDFNGWPYSDWPRYSFDGEKRITKDGVTTAWPK